MPENLQDRKSNVSVCKSNIDINVRNVSTKKLETWPPATTQPNSSYLTQSKQLIVLMNLDTTGPKQLKNEDDYLKHKFRTILFDLS